MSDPKFPRWAVDEVAETIIDENNEPQVLQNRLELSEIRMQNGWLLDTEITRQEINQLLHSICFYLNRPKSLIKANLPAASSSNLGMMYYVTDVDGGVIAVSNGTNWKKVSLGATV
jgi:hypothetical protein